MTDEVHAVEAERGHELVNVGGHRLPVVAGRRPLGLAGAPRVGRDDGEPVGEPDGETLPRPPGLREAVQADDGLGTRAHASVVDPRPGGEEGVVADLLGSRHTGTILQKNGIGSVKPRSE